MDFNDFILLLNTTGMLLTIMLLQILELGHTLFFLE